LLVLVSTLFTKYYQDHRESEPLVTAVSIIGLTLCLCVLALGPLDIFLVSTTMDLDTGLKHGWATQDYIENVISSVKLTYYVLFICIAIVCFLIIPFSYFYFEELEIDETIRQRSCGAAKYTIFTFVIGVILLFSGLSLKRRYEEPETPDPEWFRQLFSGSGVEHGLLFTTAILILAGCGSIICYTATGLSILPIILMRGKGKRIVGRMGRGRDEAIQRCRERRERILRRYGVMDVDVLRPMSSRDAQELIMLDQEVDEHERRLHQAIHASRAWWSRLFLGVWRPISMTFGIFLLIVSIALALSMFLTLVEKVRTSICGSDCGYIIDHPDAYNPVNLILLRLEHHFPLDYIFIVLIILYFFTATVVGLVRVGIRIFWINLYRIRPRRTAPQALLLAVILLMLSLLALNYTVTMTVAPQYAQFGAQRWCNHISDEGIRDCSNHTDQILACDVTAPQELCTATVLSTLLNKILVGTRYFGALYYYAQWVFLGLFLLIL
ncbi:hypothetical protein BJ684DRAFT_6282, partial [Piptocephalis cylindrospora]